MSGRIKRILLVGSLPVAVVAVMVALRSGMAAFFIMQAESIQHAGTWEDDPQNWYRAFGVQPPSQVKVIHSKYWRSNHFTYEFVSYFEVEATPEWRDEFLRRRGLAAVSPSTASSFRTYNHSDGIPDWFAPDPVELYGVWDIMDHPGSVWINKATGHIFFSEEQL
jgi:hypothetical protein